ncbi:MAG: hypothetical protein JAY75_20405, partial [Candidatus Thiodiazotropha taylori]|nr:hypothetical protein [Candidatus Thiodiazotropha taylori]MCW4310583.1 hypothetical protein [Candidatus Thiodiazotropha endolucinida]
SKIDLFVKEGIPLLKQKIAQHYENLDELNNLFEKALGNVSSSKPSHCKNEQKAIAIEAEVSSADNTVVNVSLEKSSYYCPNCEEPAESQTIACEICDCWYHYGCVGVTINDVAKINSAVPFICENCSEGEIYGSTQNLSNQGTENQGQNVSNQGIEDQGQPSGNDKSNRSSVQERNNYGTDSARLNHINQSGTSALSLNDASGSNSVSVDESVVLNKGKPANTNGASKQTNSNPVKSKKTQNLEQKQHSLAQAQYIQRLESKLQELQSTVSVLKRKDQLFNGSSVNITNSNNSDSWKENANQSEENHMPLLNSCDNVNSLISMPCHVQNMDHRLKQLETNMFQNLYLMTMSNTQTYMQLQQQANMLHTIQMEQMRQTNCLAGSGFPSNHVGNPLATPHSNCWQAPQSMYGTSYLFNSSIPPPGLPSGPHVYPTLNPVNSGPHMHPTSNPVNSGPRIPLAQSFGFVNNGPYTSPTVNSGPHIHYSQTHVNVGSGPRLPPAQATRSVNSGPHMPPAQATMPVNSGPRMPPAPAIMSVNSGPRIPPAQATVSVNNELHLPPKLISVTLNNGPYTPPTVNSGPHIHHPQAHMNVGSGPRLPPAQATMSVNSGPHMPPAQATMPVNSGPHIPSAQSPVVANSETHIYVPPHSPMLANSGPRGQTPVLAMEGSYTSLGQGISHAAAESTSDESPKLPSSEGESAGLSNAKEVYGSSEGTGSFLSIPSLHRKPPERVQDEPVLFLTERQ